MSLDEDKKTPYEAPRLMSLTAPGGANAAACPTGSGAADGCVHGADAGMTCNAGAGGVQPGYCVAGGNPQFPD
jgi:hypothetical protein